VGDVRPRLTLERREPQAHAQPVRDRPAPGVRPHELVTQPDADRQLLADLPAQGRLWQLTGLDLAAGELPPAGHLGRRRSLAGQHATIGDDRRPDDHLA